MNIHECCIVSKIFLWNKMKYFNTSDSWSLKGVSKLKKPLIGKNKKAIKCQILRNCLKFPMYFLIEDLFILKMSTYVSKTLKQHATIFGVLAFIFFVYSSYIITVALPFDWFSFTNFIGTITNILMHFFAVMICNTYILASYINPGEVPKGWVHNTSLSEYANQTESWRCNWWRDSTCQEDFRWYTQYQTSNLVSWVRELQTQVRFKRYLKVTNFL